MNLPSRGAKNGRDKAGRFTAGHAGGPGRPRGQAEYLQAMKDAVTPAQWAAACKAVAQAAGAGDVQAFKALAAYLAGQPVQRIELNAEANAALERLQAIADKEGCSTLLEAVELLEERAKLDLSHLTADELREIIKELS